MTFLFTVEFEHSESTSGSLNNISTSYINRVKTEISRLMNTNHKFEQTHPTPNSITFFTNNYNDCLHAKRSIASIISNQHDQRAEAQFGKTAKIKMFKDHEYKASPKRTNQSPNNCRKNNPTSKYRTN